MTKYLPRPDIVARVIAKVPMPVISKVPIPVIDKVTLSTATDSYVCHPHKRLNTPVGNLALVNKVQKRLRLRNNRMQEYGGRI